MNFSKNVVIDIEETFLSVVIEKIFIDEFNVIIFKCWKILCYFLELYFIMLEFKIVKRKLFLKLLVIEEELEVEV